MRLVVDTNVLFSFFVPQSKVRRLFKSLAGDKVSLLVPEDVLEELIGLVPQITKYVSFDRFTVLFILLLKLSRVVPRSEYEKFLKEDKRISPHAKDAPLFALSLAFNKAPIWSRGPRLRRQKAVKVLFDKEIERLLKSKK